MNKIWPQNCRVCLVLKHFAKFESYVVQILVHILPCKWGAGVTRAFLNTWKIRSFEKGLADGRGDSGLVSAPFFLSPPMIAIPASPYRGQNWKVGKMTFLGSKNAFLGVPLGTI